MPNQRQEKEQSCEMKDVISMGCEIHGNDDEIDHQDVKIPGVFPAIDPKEKIKAEEC